MNKRSLVLRFFATHNNGILHQQLRHFAARVAVSAREEVGGFQ